MVRFFTILVLLQPQFKVIGATSIITFICTSQYIHPPFQSISFMISNLRGRYTVKLIQEMLFKFLPSPDIMGNFTRFYFLQF